MKIPLYLISIERDFHTRTKKQPHPLRLNRKSMRIVFSVPPLWHRHIGKVARNNRGANSMEMSKNTGSNGNRIKHWTLTFLICNG